MKDKNKLIKFVFVLTFAIAMVIGTAGVCFAAPMITDKNIEEGLDFCKEYPVGLTLDGKVIEFSESDVPPVIITPEGENAGRTLIPARALFEALGAKVEWIEATQTVEITYKEIIVSFAIGAETAKVGTEEKALEVPALIIDHDKDYYGSTMIPVRFAAESIGCGVKWDDETRTVMITSPAVTEPEPEPAPEPEEPNRGDTGNRGEVAGYLFPEYTMDELPMLTENAKTKLIALDAGHGGIDGGAVGHEDLEDEILEKDIDLEVALMIRDYLEAAGANIYMTRDRDTYIEKTQRAYAANDKGADFFLSIHINSSEYASPRGTEVHYYKKANEASKYGIESVVAARHIQDEMVAALGTLDRGLKSSPKLAVLNKTAMPAVIVEGAFISNEKDFEML